MNQITNRAHSYTVRVLSEERQPPQPARRHFLRLLGMHGVSIPASYFLIGSAFADEQPAEPRSDQPINGNRHKGLMRVCRDVGTGAPKEEGIIRDFSDPSLECLRLLREASEIEHALMLQYLYAAFSLKPAYQGLVGPPTSNAQGLLGVAIQEMQHLAEVNRLLVTLGGAANLVRQDFPYEPDIYPFPFHLEPLSRETLAKYAYVEAPAGALDRERGEDPAFIEAMEAVLGPGRRLNHLGSLYDNLIARLQELSGADYEGVLDLEQWVQRLEDIKEQGEEDHFLFFKSLFMGTHEGFQERADVWDLDRADPAYPAYPLARNPSAYVGHANQIEDPVALSIAWLGNLHYWATLMMLDLGYRESEFTCLGLAKAQMLGPLWSIGQYLPRFGVGVPFDPMSMGYAPGRARRENFWFLSRLLGECDDLAHGLAQENLLPADYPVEANGDMRKSIEDLHAAAAAASRDMSG